jgi:predicted AAA+ superfamily ATPase
MVTRSLEARIKEAMFRGKAVIILGPRQSGKTTLLKRILEDYGENGEYYNCDETEIRRLFSNQSAAILRSLIGSKRLILLDEAQRVENIGLTIKIIVDSIPGVQIVASGSSAFELTDHLSEPLTGRKREFQLLPFAFEELARHTTVPTEISHLNLRLLYGSYPEVATSPGTELEILTELSSSYLYKDMFAFNDIRKPDLIEKLLTALALQVGSEVSYNELAQLLDSDRSTIERYIQILERAYIILRLVNYSTNQRNEIKRSRKIYFWDNGIRNAILSDYRPIELRDDIGKLWENYMVSELMKRRANHALLCKPYFWRSANKSEIDYLELENARIKAYEFKWNPRKEARALAFLRLYPAAAVEVVNPANYFTHLLPDSASG